jgi:predicted HAD superfamily Cof-like phosphohydrolase
MNQCTVCGSHNLNAFRCVKSIVTGMPELATYGNIAWCEDCGSLHVEGDNESVTTWQPEKSMLHHQVLAFHKRFGQSIGERPHVLDDKTMRFRLSLIAEEFKELLDAAFGGEEDGYEPRWPTLLATLPLKFDLPAFADALADLAYVMEGTAISMGINMTPIAEEVHRANMAKLPSYVAAKDATHRVYEPTRPGVPAEIVQAVNDAVPIKRPDGKIMKPPNWQPPDIEGELRKQGWEE